jgi:MFS family permease
MTVDKKTHIRYLIVTMLFIASCFSYGDRAALSVAGAAIQKALALDSAKMGLLFSGFGWAYVFGQLPAGGLLDRFGSKRVYGISIVCWSVCAFLIGFAGYLTAAWAFSAIFGLRCVVSHSGARSGLRYLQCLAIFRIGDVRSTLRMADQHLWLAKLFLGYGLLRPRTCVRVVEAGLQREGAPADLPVRD